MAEALDRIPAQARVVSICTGAFILSATGMLDDRRATTHWHLTDRFRRRFPRVELDPDVLFVDEGRILTSAGAASGVDACLHLVRTDHGSEIAAAVARQCFVPPFRDGGQAQHIEHPVPDTGSAGTAPARSWALEHLRAPLDLATLARRAGMSPRIFSRRFTAEVGVSPGAWVIAQRVARARHLLESTELPVDRVAEEVGFATGASLRRHFHATMDVAPTVYSGTFRRASRQLRGAAHSPTARATYADPDRTLAEVTHAMHQRRTHRLASLRCDARDNIRETTLSDLYSKMRIHRHLSLRG